MEQFAIPKPVPRYPLEVVVIDRGPYGPHDVYLGGTWVAVRKYDGSDHAEIAAEFVEHLATEAVAGKPLWSINKLAGTEEDSAPEDPYARLIRLTETHLQMLMAGDFSAPLVDRLRRDNCTHDWSASRPLSGYHDEIECLKCGLHVIDGYRPYYPKGSGS